MCYFCWLLHVVTYNLHVCVCMCVCIFVHMYLTDHRLILHLYKFFEDWYIIPFGLSNKDLCWLYLGYWPMTLELTSSRFVGQGVCAQLLQLCPTLCDPMNCSPPASSAHGILQARILQWVTMPSSRGSSRPRDWTHVSCISCIAGGFFTIELPGKPTGQHK